MNSLPSVKTPNAGVLNAIGGVGNPDDLRSYEAAVLARKAPSLSMEGAQLVRSRRNNSNATGKTGAGSMSPPMMTTVNISRPQVQPASSSAQPRQAAIPVNLSSSLPAIPHIFEGISTDDKLTAERPSFKRLASQTLGPEESKFIKTEGAPGTMGDLLKA